MDQSQYQKFLEKEKLCIQIIYQKSQSQNLLEGIQNMTIQAPRLVEGAKLEYFTNIGRKLSDPSTGTKKYLSLINEILNQSKIPEIPPLLEGDVFLTSFASKAQIFNDNFILQCTALNSGSKITGELPVTSFQLRELAISDDKILKIVRNLNPNKAHGWDGLSGRMIKMCDESLVRTLYSSKIACIVAFSLTH